MQDHWLQTQKEPDLIAERPWIVLCWGAPAAGKSTLAHALCQSLPFCVPRLSSDAMNRALIGEAFLAELRPAIYEGLLAMGEAILKQGGRLVLDGTFLQPQARQQVAELARRCGACLLSVQVECPLELRARRNSGRPDWEKVPAGWLHQAHSRARLGRRDCHLLLDTSALSTQESVERCLELLRARLRRHYGLVPKSLK